MISRASRMRNERARARLHRAAAAAAAAPLPPRPPTLALPLPEQQQQTSPAAAVAPYNNVPTFQFGGGAGATNNNDFTFDAADNHFAAAGARLFSAMTDADAEAGREQHNKEDKTASMASPQDDSKIKALEAQVKSLKKELEDTTKRLDSVTKLSLQHESATAAEKKKYEHVVEENKLQYDNNGDLQSQLEEKEKEYKKLEQQWHTEVENGRLKDFELQKLHQKYKESSNRRSGPEEAQLKTKDETIASLKLDLSHSREELRTLRADYRKITQIRQDLGRENILLENDLIDRARELDRVQLENNTMEEERNQLLEMRDVVNDYFNLSVDLSPNALRHFLDDWLDEQKISPSGLSAKHARGASLADEIDKDEFEDESASSVEDEEQDKPSGEEEQGKETPDQGEPPKAALPSDGQPGKSSTATNERIIVKEASMRSKLATLLIIALLLWFILPQDRHVWLAANEYSRQSLISVRDGSMWMWLMASRPVLESRFMLEQLLDFDRGLLG